MASDVLPTLPARFVEARGGHETELKGSDGAIELELGFQLSVESIRIKVYLFRWMGTLATPLVLEHCWHSPGHFPLIGKRIT